MRTLGVVVRAKAGTSPARLLAHAERARRNLEAVGAAKRGAAEDDPGNGAVTIRAAVLTSLSWSFDRALDDVLARWIRSMR